MKKLKLKYLILSLVTLGLLGFAGYEAWKDYQTPVLTEKQSTYQASAQQILKDDPPSDPARQVTYYGVAASNFYVAEDYENALSYYLKTQAVIDDNGLDTALYHYYGPIADCYEKLNNSAKAKEYLQKEIDILKASGLSAEDLKPIEERLSRL